MIGVFSKFLLMYLCSSVFLLCSIYLSLSLDPLFMWSPFQTLGTSASQFPKSLLTLCPFSFLKTQRPLLPTPFDRTAEKENEGLPKDPIRYRGFDGLVFCRNRHTRSFPRDLFPNLHLSPTSLGSHSTLSGPHKESGRSDCRSRLGPSTVR